MFFPLSVLSYTSILGILSTILIIAVLLFDGLTKPQAPGSLWDPMDTSLNISSPAGLGVAFGLFMAGVSTPLFDSEFGNLNVITFFFF